MFKGIRHPVKSCLLGGLLAISSMAQAHPLWVLPSEFSLSTEEGQGQWVSFDVSASHTVFAYDKGVPLDSFKLYAPDGDRQPLGSYFKGHRRSVFELYLDQNGTYKIEGQRPAFYFTSYKSGKRDTPKRMMANKQEAKQRLPKNARDVSTLLIDLSTRTYVTNNTPSDSVLTPAAKGLDLNLLTHPSDIVVGEPVELALLLDGKPVSDVEVEITPGGTRYRSERGALQLNTDQQGAIRFTPEQAGPWLLGASLKSPVDSPLADYKMSIRYMSFEVLPE
ncbi:DUF4198 domain-containing protein [Neptuniibacter halophilus]|uniref:DUF4198 domain-containing protein n=1 Tax=Neptuniibacter halophilus TaxID=651666 RepID=UPI002572F1E7|nr:DUF4198 domain-containing protein [Neptuniibacter halophilus]